MKCVQEFSVLYYFFCNSSVSLKLFQSKVKKKRIGYKEMIIESGNIKAFSKGKKGCSDWTSKYPGR